MRKPHACGGNVWTVIRAGADIKIRCQTCGHIVMLDRLKFLKSGKKTLAGAENAAIETAGVNEE
ncbi:MAG: DUF951 domain-containing protein [Clostridiales bacterium]|nr:DUF951 domain-containing protein [Clostridiales bacterium]